MTRVLFLSRFVALLLILGMALPAPVHALRATNTAESAGLEEDLGQALGGRENRRDWIKRVVGAVAAGVAAALPGQSPAGEPSTRLPETDPVYRGMRYLRGQVGDTRLFLPVTVDDVTGRLKMDPGKPPVVGRKADAASQILPTSIWIDPFGIQFANEAIAKEVGRGELPASVLGRYHKLILHWQGRADVADDCRAVQALLLVSAPGRLEPRERRMQQELALQIIDGLLSREFVLEGNRQGVIGNSYVVMAGKEGENLNVFTRNQTLVGQALAGALTLGDPPAMLRQPLLDAAFRFANTHRRLMTHKNKTGQPTGLICGGRSGEAGLPWASTSDNIQAYFFLQDLLAYMQRPNTQKSLKTQYREQGRQVAEMVSGLPKAILDNLYDAKGRRFLGGFGNDEQMLEANVLGALLLIAQGREKEAGEVRRYIEETFLREERLEGEPLIGYSAVRGQEFVSTRESLLVALLDRRLRGDPEAPARARSILAHMDRLQTPEGGVRLAYPTVSLPTAPDEWSLYHSMGDSGATAMRIMAESNTLYAPTAKGGLEEDISTEGAPRTPAKARAGLEEPITAEDFVARYGEQLDGIAADRRQRIEQLLANDRLVLTDVTVPDTLPLYAQGADLFAAVLEHVQPRAQGIQLDTHMLPVAEFLDTGVILKDPGIPEEVANLRGLPVVPLSPQDVVEDPKKALLAILCGRLGIVESADVLAELFWDAQGKMHVLIFA